MKRDMNLIRSILLEIEKHCETQASKIHIPDCSQDLINYHIYILVQGDLLLGVPIRDQRSTIPRDFVGLHLTWNGHEFLDAARDATHWKKAMNIVEEKGGSVTVGVLVQILASLLKLKFGLS